MDGEMHAANIAPVVKRDSRVFLIFQRYRLRMCRKTCANVWLAPHRQSGELASDVPSADEPNDRHGNDYISCHCPLFSAGRDHPFIAHRFKIQP
jgi:hypothetical protein